MTDGGFPTEIELLAAEINSSFLERRQPRFERGTVAAWVEAVNLQMLNGQIEAVEHGLRHLRERFPAVTYASRVSEIFDRLPLAATRLPFKDDPARELQIVACEGAETVVLLFCGIRDMLGLPLAVVHRWTGRLNASLIYLRDFRKRFYLEGIAELGKGRSAAIDGLRKIVASLGGKRIACYGNSSGVFGALHYGLDLDAYAVLCLGGAVNLDPKFNAYSSYEERCRQLRAALPDAALDLRALYESASRMPAVRMIYGAEHWNDRLHAEYMGVLPCVTLQAVENFGEHNVVVELIRRQQFEAVLRWLVPDPAAGMTDQYSTRTR